MKKTTQPSFEESLATLENLVAQMDNGELSLEQSLEAFEQGIKLVRQCQQQLHSAEQKVQQLIGDENHLQLEAFDQVNPHAATEFKDDLPF